MKNQETPTKILEFPKSKIVRDVPSEVIEARAKKMDKKFADSIVADISSSIVSELDDCNLDVESEDFTKDYVFMVDVLKSVVYRQFGIDHHLHKYIDEHVKIIDLSEAGAIIPEDVQKLVESEDEKELAKLET